jgi:hypothetical protein
MTFNVNNKTFFRIIIMSLKDLFKRVLCLALFGFYGIPEIIWYSRKNNLFGRMSYDICSIFSTSLIRNLNALFWYTSANLYRNQKCLLSWSVKFWFQLDFLVDILAIGLRFSFIEIFFYFHIVRLRPWLQSKYLTSVSLFLFPYIYIFSIS